MPSPGFLGIGAARAGTTWLDLRLREHPDLFLPRHRKEVHYFDKYYERGSAWYESFFTEAAANQLVGEITPRYLFDPAVPRRISQSLPTETKFLVVLRDPAARAVSHYQLKVRDDAVRVPFEDYLRQDPEILEYGMYARQLTRYFDLFGAESVLVLVFEETLADQPRALQQVGDFLGVDATKFRESSERVNASTVPRLPRVRRLARRGGVRLRELGLDRVVEAVKAAGGNRLFDSTRTVQPPSEEVLAAVRDHYRDSVAELADLLGRDLSRWPSH